MLEVMPMIHPAFALGPFLLTSVMGGVAPHSGGVSKPEAYLKRCPPDTPDHPEGLSVWHSLDGLVEGLAEDSELELPQKELSALLSETCFQPAREAGEPPVFEHVLSFKAWWEEGGGDWLMSYLEARTTGTGTPEIVIPPGRRSALATLEPGHPLLCPAADADCGWDTFEWGERATRALADRGEPSEAPDASAAQCYAEAQQRDAKAYLRWRDCVEQGRRVVAVLPLGRTRAPRSGRLSVTLPADLDGVCEVTSIVDLETGAASIVEGCRPVWHMRWTDGGQIVPSRTRRGRMEAELAREALWMLTLVDHVQSVRPAVTVPVPPGMKIQFRPQDIDHSALFYGCGLRIWDGEWTWTSRGGADVASGALDFGGHASAYVKALVEALNDSFVD